jgi:glutathione S-transferase
MPITIRLYTFPPSQNSVRPEIALREKGLDFEIVAVDLLAGENKKPPLSEINPRGQVPTLVWDDGSGPIVIYESIATIRFIDDMVSEPPLLPPVSDGPLRAQALMRIEEFQAKLDPKNVFGSVAFRKQGREQLGQRVDDLLAELQQWDQYVAGQAFLAGDASTLADIAVFPLLMHFEALGFDYASRTPGLAVYLERCKSRPSVQASGWLDVFEAFVARLGVAKVLAD